MSIPLPTDCILLAELTLKLTTALRVASSLPNSHPTRNDVRMRKVGKRAVREVNWDGASTTEE